MQWTEHLTSHITTEIKLMFSHLSSVYVSKWKNISVKGWHSKTKYSHFSPFSNCHHSQQKMIYSIGLGQAVSSLIFLQICWGFRWYLTFFRCFIGFWGFWGKFWHLLCWFLPCTRNFSSSISLVEKTIIHANSFQYQSIVYQDQHTLSVSDMIHTTEQSSHSVRYFNPLQSLQSLQHKLN